MPHVSAANGVRQSSASLHLTRAVAAAGTRLEVRTGCEARRLLLANGTAVGVKYFDEGRLRFAGKHLASNDELPSDLLPALRRLLSLPAQQELELFEEVEYRCEYIGILHVSNP